MCWSDLNTHYGYKLTFFTWVAVRRLIYAYSLVEMNSVCGQIKYFTMLNIIQLALTIFLRPFKSRYLLHCATVDDTLLTIASVTYFAFFHTESTKLASVYFPMTILGCCALMPILKAIIIIKEMYRRSKEYEIEAQEPTMPVFELPKKEKKVKLEEPEEELEEQEVIDEKPPPKPETDDDLESVEVTESNEEEPEDETEEFEQEEEEPPEEDLDIG
mmetsp:Transcript_31962/g.31233  ORF Transcript_31962/g.31233 Transcript_31962/m.31233 type:complete len:216 (-) Transcript_31962:223-870(-)